jgi:(S)-mandelate dehydrogenase
MTLSRKLYTGRNFHRALSIDELRGIGKSRVPNFAFEYVEGGSEDEQSLRWNKTALESIRLIPGTLVDTSERHQRIKLMGRDQNSPLVIGPTGLNGMLRYRGDIALARAAASSGIPFTLSTVSNVRLEEVAEEAGGDLWMQLYVMTDRDITLDILNRAKQANYSTLVFTTDANVFGYREWDRRNYRAPAKLTLRNMLDVATHPGWVFSTLVPHGIPRFENIVDFMPPEAKSASGGVAIFPRLFPATICWDDVAWLRQAWPHKLVIKGVLNVEDARKAAELGCDGIVLTNHGGRQLDSCIAPIEALPEISQAVGEQLAIIIDSGFRRGTDIIKALALGAHAVMLGRAVLYGLAAGGEPGVRHALSILTTEIDRALGQLGCRSIEELGPHILKR